MQQEVDLTNIVSKNAILIVGNKLIVQEKELETASKMINSIFSFYFDNEIFQKIPHRTRPMVTYGVCFDCTQLNGVDSYTFLVGEEVEKIEHLPKGLSNYTIPKQDYIVFQAGPGPVMEIAKQTWQKAASQDYKSAGLCRTFRDFEYYDENCTNVFNMTYQIYIGVEKIKE